MYAQFFDELGDSEDALSEFKSMESPSDDQEGSMQGRGKYDYWSDLLQQAQSNEDDSSLKELERAMSQSVGGGGKSISPNGSMPTSADGEDEDLGGVEEDLEQEAPQSGMGDSSDDDDSLVQYVFNKMEDLGYPPRRLEEFSDEFVEEQIFPAGNREVTITMPDRYYGKRKSLSHKDIQAIIQEITAKFGLSFVQGSREGKKLSLEFTSAQSPELDEEGEEGEGVGTTDVLDEVFGERKSKKGQKKKASSGVQTLQEMLRDNQDNILSLLKEG